MKYKVGDTVKIKSFDWYNKNKNFNGFVACNNAIFSKDMSQFCGKPCIIQSCYIEGTYKLVGIPYYFSSDMFEEDIKKVSIEIPEGYEIDRENSTFENIIFKKKRTINTFSDLIEIKGFHIDKSSKESIKVWESTPNNVIIFIDEEHAKSAIALAKISQLMPYYGGEVTEEEWKNDEWKYSILVDTNRISSYKSAHIRDLIAFHTEEQRDKFLSFPENVQLVKDLYMVD